MCIEKLSKGHYQYLVALHIATSAAMGFSALQAKESSVHGRLLFLVVMLKSSPHLNASLAASQLL